MRIYTERELEDLMVSVSICGLDMADHLLAHQGKGSFALVRPAFHGGGKVSTHRSLRAALQEMGRQHRHHTGDRSVFGQFHRGQGCRCGFPNIIKEEDYDSLPLASQAAGAYSSARND